MRKRRDLESRRIPVAAPAKPHPCGVTPSGHDPQPWPRPQLPSGDPPRPPAAPTGDAPPPQPPAVAARPPLPAVPRPRGDPQPAWQPLSGGPPPRPRPSTYRLRPSSRAAAPSPATTPLGPRLPLPTREALGRDRPGRYPMRRDHGLHGIPAAAPQSPQKNKTSV
ncbi:hypothetical protein NL676_039475 [Syzygium grande]|nr:hypothetical protein NL676_039475 [Syzygium grande]